NNRLTLALVGDDYGFTDVGEAIVVEGSGSAGWSGSGTIQVTGPAGGITAIDVHAGDANNDVNVRASTAVPLAIDGRGGSTRIVLGSQAGDVGPGTLANLRGTVHVR